MYLSEAFFDDWNGQGNPSTWDHTQRNDTTTQSKAGPSSQSKRPTTPSTTRRVERRAQNESRKDDTQTTPRFPAPTLTPKKLYLL